jgi:general stress protein 26
MTWLPETITDLLEAALVAELTAVRSSRRPVTYPLIPLWDGERILMTSSILFSRKLEHLKAEPRVSLSLSDPVALGGRMARATIQGIARVVDGDPHTDWERVLPLWEAKEPVIRQFLKARVAFPLFFERAVIEVTPQRAYLWPDGDTSKAPIVSSAPGGSATTAVPDAPVAEVA